MAIRPICGNKKKNGRVCWVCARAEHDQKAHGGRSRVLKRIRSRTDGHVQGKSTPIIASIVSTPGSRLVGGEPQHRRLKPDSWRRLEGFNRLLKDIYGREVRASTILTKHGVPLWQTRRWKLDEVWLLRFVDCLERNFVLELTRIFSKETAIVVTHLYGFATEKEVRPRSIAYRLGTSLSRVVSAREKVVGYLRTVPGRKLLERIVLASALTNRDQVVMKKL